MLVERINEITRRVPPWMLYALGLLPAAWLWGLAVTGNLGPEPIGALEREFGALGLKFLIGSLLVSPARRYLGLNLLRYRRALALVSFYYILQHLGVWLLLDIGDPARIWADILKRPYVTVGLASFLAMLPLALTSNDLSIRRLGVERWRALHRLAYFAAAAAAVHYIMLVKGWPLEPFVYGLIVVLIIGFRFWLRPRRAAA